jgi:hypothetical protein
MKFVLIAAAGLGLGACAWGSSQCVQPDPVEPAHNHCWDRGVDCGTGIQDNSGASLAK